MAQPTAYDRIASFTNLQALAPSDPLPGNTVDAEFNAVKATIDEILDNLALIQRDDGDLADASVGTDQLSTELSVGINTWTVWVTGTAYAVLDTVFHGSGVYRCAIAHTSGTFATDLTAVKWTLVLDLSTLTLGAASGIANTPAGNIAATTVQAALNELDAEKALLSHTHVASAISDSTADGRAFLTATLAAQKVLLGLGSLAYLNTVAVTSISAQIALTGIIEPAALGADTNDWAPTGIGTCSTVRMSASVAVNLTGVLAPAVDGSLLVLENVGTSFAITLQPSSTSSAAANRFLIQKPHIIGPNQSVVLKYDLDGSVPRWRLFDRVASLPRGWIDGLTCSNAADTVNDITVAAGECRGARGILDLVLSSAITKQLDADWTAGNNVGGRYVSSANNPAIANTDYHIHLIGKADGTTDVMFYTGVDPSSVLPTGYVDYHHIMSINRAAGAILQFTQLGDEVLYTTVPAVNGTSSLSTTPQNIVCTGIPTGLKMIGIFNISVDHATLAPGLYAYSPDQSDQASADAVAPLSTVRRYSGGVAFAPAVRLRVDTSGRLRAVSTNTNTTIAIATLGFGHPRGRNA